MPSADPFFRGVDIEKRVCLSPLVSRDFSTKMFSLT
jgi:hypothetical protein